MPRAPGSAPMCPGTTSTTVTVASRCSPPPRSTTGRGCSDGNNAIRPNRLTTTDTLNGSANDPTPQPPAPSSGSTYPPNPNQNDSRQLDNDRPATMSLGGRQRETLSGRRFQ